MSKHGKSDTRQVLRDYLVTDLKERPAYFNLQEISSHLRKAGIRVSPNTLKTYLSRFMAEGGIHGAGRGWYSRIPQPFVLDTAPIQKLISRLRQAFPFLDFSAWSTKQINPYTQHILNCFVCLVYADPDTLPAIAEELPGYGYLVEIDPGKSDAPIAAPPGEGRVVLRKTIKKQPPAIKNAAPIEKILVDLWYESPKLNLMDPSEARIVIENAVERGRVNMAALLGYAGERRQDFSWMKTIYQLRNK